MKFTCNSCGAQYMISDEKVGPNGVKVRCKKCGNVVHVKRATEEAAAPAPAAGGPGATNGAGSTNGAAAPAAGLDAELGQAFDNAFGDAPPAATPAQDLATTQASAPEDQAKVAAAAPAATEWYVAIGQAQVGPLPLAEVKRKWEAGDVGPDSLVWRPGMGDWQPLSSVSELAGYLAPVARAAAPAARAEASASRGAAQAAPDRGAAEPAPAASEEVSWKPVGASALAALASEEIAARSTPAERKPAAAAGGPAAPSGVKSLVEGLPDGGGVDPTGAIPLPIKALEQTGKLERRSTVATRAEEARHKRSMTRVIAIAAVVVVAAVGGAAAYVVTQKKPSPAPVAVAPPAPPPAPPVQAAPPPTPTPPVQPAPPAQTAPVQAEPAGQAPPAAVAATPPAATPAKQPEPPAAKAEAEPPARKGAKGKQAKVARAEPPPRPAPVAHPPPATEPAPRPAATRKKDSLLDFDSSDSALDEALGGSSGGSGRSVYVPPTRGGSLPDKLSPAQINEAVAGRIDSLRRCVSEQKARDPAASGVLKMKWVISGDGSVRDVKSLPGEYASGPFSSCITGVVRGIKFPRSATAGQEVTFPFSF